MRADDEPPATRVVSELGAARLALERALPGWGVRCEDDTLTLTADRLADGLVLELRVDVVDGELDAMLELSHPVAQHRLLVAHNLTIAQLDRELELETDPDALARAVAVEAARLVATAGTLDLFVAALREEPHFSGDAADVAAAARGDARFPDERPGPGLRQQWRDAAAQVQARRDALGAVAAQGLEDPDARAEALDAELGARGRTETPLWIRSHAEPPPRASARGLLRDVVDLTRKLRDGGLEPVPYATGPWHEVALGPDAQPVLAAAFDAAPNRVGTMATLAAEVRPGGAVVLGNAVVGHAAAAGPGLARLQLGRVGTAGRFAAQVQSG
jgi:hypothetical protein